MAQLDPATALSQLEAMAVQRAADEIFSAVDALNLACQNAAAMGLCVEFSQTAIQRVQEEFASVMFEAAVSRLVRRTLTRPMPGSPWQSQKLNAGTTHEYINPSKGAQQCQS